MRLSVICHAEPEIAHKFCRLGIASSYGVPSGAVEQAFDRGVNYFYWGSLRRNPFGDGLRALAPRRDRFLLVTQSYSRVASLIATRWSALV